MPYNPDIHHRRSIRLPGYDYSGFGWYYVTICVNDRKPNLSRVHQASICLTYLGKIVKQAWCSLRELYTYVSLDDFIIMPNHLHGIIVIDDDIQKEKRKSLGRLIGVFKTVSTKQINQYRNTPGLQYWQRNYYEHIIRNEQELAHFKDYIRTNPLKWTDDINHLDY